MNLKLWMRKLDQALHAKQFKGARPSGIYKSSICYWFLLVQPVNQSINQWIKAAGRSPADRFSRVPVLFSRWVKRQQQVNKRWNYCCVYLVSCHQDSFDCSLSAHICVDSFTDGLSACCRSGHITHSYRPKVSWISVPVRSANINISTCQTIAKAVMSVTARAGLAKWHPLS